MLWQLDIENCCNILRSKKDISFERLRATRVPENEPTEFGQRFESRSTDCHCCKTGFNSFKRTKCVTSSPFKLQDYEKVQMGEFTNQ